MKSSLFAPVLVFVLAFLAHQYRHELHLPETLHAVMGGIGDRSEQSSFDWPPQVGQTYPDLELYDQQGNKTRLTEFRGKIILLEPIGMPCKACQAFCGGHTRGGFNGIVPQPDLPSLKDAARTYGGFSLSDPRIVVVHLLLFNLDMQAPSVEDARAWAEHFGMDRDRNQVVLAGSPELVNQASYKMIPGLQLIDRDFKLRYDSTGRTNPRHDLYRELLPAVKGMLDR